MNNEELKLVLEIFSKVTDGAMVGGITYLLINLIQNIFPWAVGGWLGSKLIGKLPRISLAKKESK